MHEAWTIEITLPYGPKIGASTFKKLEVSAVNTWKFNYSEVEFFKIHAVSLKLVNVLNMVQIAWKYS